MFQKVRRTCWNKYVDELDQKLNERILPPVPTPKEDIDMLTNKVHSVITKSTKSYEAPCLCESRFVRKITVGGILSKQAFEKRLAVLGEKPLKQEDWEAQKPTQSISKKLSEEHSAIYGIAL